MMERKKEFTGRKPKLADPDHPDHPEHPDHPDHPDYPDHRDQPETAIAELADSSSWDARIVPWSKREHAFLKSAPMLTPGHHSPPTAPTPRTPHSAREVSQRRAGGAGGQDLCSPSPGPLSSLLLAIATNQKHSYITRPQAHHAGPPGGGGLPLPAAVAAAP